MSYHKRQHSFLRRVRLFHNLTMQIIPAVFILFVLSTQSALFADPLDTIDLTEEEIVRIKEQDEVSFSFTARKQPMQYHLRLNARVDFKYIAGSNPAMYITVNNTIIGADKLRNKPDAYSSKRLPAGRPMVVRNSFDVFSSPGFEPMDEEVIYRPIDFTDEQIYEFVLDITDAVKPEKNIIIIKNSIRPDEKNSLILILENPIIEILPPEQKKKEATVQKKVPVLTGSGYKFPFSLEKQDTSFVDQHIKTIMTSAGMPIWLKAFQSNVLESCRYWLEKNMDHIWYSVPTQNVPRSLFVNQLFGSPVSGTAINSFDYYQWDYNPSKFPWKLIEPVSGDLFPKNDFFAYMVSGINPFGMFDPERADKSLLFNTENNNKNDPLYNFGVDPGTGFVGAGKKFNFIGFYAMHILWAGSANFPHKPYAVANGPLFLAHAWEWTGDIRYARAALVLIDRIADIYPGLDFQFWAKQGGYHQYPAIHGKDMDETWSMLTASKLARAYVMVRGEIDKDKVFLDFVKKKAVQFRLYNLKDSPDAVKKHIEENIIRTAFTATRFRIISGNQGFSEEAALWFALAVSDRAFSKEILDWLFRPWPDGYGGLYEPGKEREGGGLLETIADGLTSDGFSREGGNGYIRILPQALVNIYEIISGGALSRQNPEYAPVFEYLRLKLTAYYRSAVNYSCAGKFCPNFGDGWSFASPADMIAARPRELLRGFYTLGDDMLGSMFLNKYITNEKGPRTEKIKIFLNDPSFMSLFEDPGIFADPKVIAGISGKLDKLTALPQWGEKSVVMPGRGFTLIKSGSGSYRRALAMNFGDNTGHNHLDSLNLDLFAFGLSITPNAGYPSMPEKSIRYYWWDNTLSHWTVAFPNRHMSNSILSRAQMFSQSPIAGVFTADARESFPGLTRYDRTAVLVNTDDTPDGKGFYVADFFRVDGAETAMYCFHSSIGAVIPENLKMRAQPSGTMAGEKVPYGTEEEKYGGLAFVFDVSRAQVKNTASILWNLDDFRKTSPFGNTIRTRFRIFHPEFELVTGKGKLPQSQSDPQPHNTHAFAVSSMKRPLFMSIVECFEDGKNPVAGVRELPVIRGSRYAGGLVVNLKDGSQDIILTTGGADEQADYAEGYMLHGHFAIIRLKKNGSYLVHAAGTTAVKFKKTGLSFTGKTGGVAQSSDTAVTGMPKINLREALTIPSGVLRPLFLRLTENAIPGVSSFHEIAADSPPETKSPVLTNTFLFSDIVRRDNKIEFGSSVKPGTKYEVLFGYYREGKQE